MLNSKNRTQGKSLNPLHSSFILTRPNSSSTGKQEEVSLKLSHFQTNATSQFQYTDPYNQDQKVSQYETRIKNLESGYQRSKQQYENSIKNMYKQKIILMNIISHNQTLLNQFRSKLKIQTRSFKEIETKYNIITSGLFHNQLCPNCVFNISNADFQSKSIEKEKESPKNPETTDNLKKKRLGYHKQYSWMYLPQAEHPQVGKLKADLFKIKHNIQELTLEHSKKMNEKNRQIETLRAEVMKLSKELTSPIHKIIMCSGSKDEKKEDNLEKQLQKSKQKIKRLQEEVSCACSIKENYQNLVKEANEKLMTSELQRLNMKYRNKFL